MRTLCPQSDKDLIKSVLKIGKANALSGRYACLSMTDVNVTSKRWLEKRASAVEL